ncbi:hypothetical protein F4819DRAFT_461785 [Hypoxylon fuscum]|nr:hypothetical protein F4819DRAFT_461785 [Hypoxylon fuscum]
MYRLRAPSLIQLLSLLSVLYTLSVFITASPIINVSSTQVHTIAARADISDVPSVDVIKAELQSHGRVGTDVSLFYTSLSGGSAIQKITAWYKCNGQPIFQKAGVAWDGILPPDYLTQTAMVLQSASLIDKFQKRICQAFAAQSAGQVFVFYPDNMGDPIDICKTAGQGLNPPGGFSAWCGQEFPALMMNTRVEAIYQVDPSSGKQSGNIIWTQGDGAKLPIQDSQVN